MADHTSSTNLSANPNTNPAPNRRQLLSGASALALSSVALSGVVLTGSAQPGSTLLSGIGPAPDAFQAPGSEKTPSTDPAYEAYRRAQATEDALNSYQGAENEYYAGLAMAYMEAREVLASTPSSSLRGIHSKVMWFGEAQDWRAGDSFFDSLLGLSILKDLERLMAQVAGQAATQSSNQAPGLSGGAS